MSHSDTTMIFKKQINFLLLVKELSQRKL